MTTFKEITFERAMNLIASRQLKNVYFMSGGALVCAYNYKMSMRELHEQTWYEKEEVTS